MKKFFKLFGLNLLILAVFLLLFDIIVYSLNYVKEDLNENFSFVRMVKNFKYNLIPPPDIFVKDIKMFFNVEFDKSGRKPDGLEYTGETPITIFGCSFAYGSGLNSNQTFSYKLAHLLKRPVYNRAIEAGSPQLMYYQSLQPAFYEDVPYSDTVIFVLIGDHYRRLLIDSFCITCNSLYMHFSFINGKLYMDDYNNWLANFKKSLYTYRYFKQKKIIHDIYFTDKNCDYLTDFMLANFINTKKELQKNWNRKVNFIVIFYDNDIIPYQNMLKLKLEKNGFIVIEIKKLTDKIMNEKKYKIPNDGHPNEAAWDLLTPLIINNLKEKNIL